MHTLDKHIDYGVCDVKVVRRRKTFAWTTCARTEECVSAGGTPTAATARLATEERIVNKVRIVKKVSVILSLHQHIHS